MRPPVHQLEYFVAVAEEAQFTRAALRLHVAQPSVSAQIRLLERTLRTELFHRGNGPVTMTDAGQALLPMARRVLADLADVEYGMAELEGLRRGHVAIGATPSISAALLPTVLAQFHTRFPEVSLSVSEQGSRHLVEGIGSGALDMALAIPTLPRANFESVRLATEDLVVVTSTNHRLARSKSIALSDLALEPMVMFRDGYDLRVTTLTACAAAGFEPKAVVEGGEMSGVLALVAEGLGVAIVPSIVAADARLHRLPLRAPKLTRTIALMWRQDRTPSRAAAALLSETTRLLSRRGWPGGIPSGLTFSLK
jgi:DNA-binding transcriptional LysR family regulator